MPKELPIHIDPPANGRAAWRVRVDGGAGKDFASEREALAFAAQRAKLVGDAGGVAVMTIEREDGSRETFRV